MFVTRFCRFFFFLYISMISVASLRFYSQRLLCFYLYMRVCAHMKKFPNKKSFFFFSRDASKCSHMIWNLLYLILKIHYVKLTITAMFMLCKRHFLLSILLDCKVKRTKNAHEEAVILTLKRKNISEGTTFYDTQSAINLLLLILIEIFISRHFSGRNLKIKFIVFYSNKYISIQFKF